ncbi:hypothetical protein [Nonomuraea sp. NPDC049758]|uniref:hypothetical protein n=1 Tax=Nonomuraea sp. NPDC049758 TaxID=3154360 RepID=UPI0034241601
MCKVRVVHARLASRQHGGRQGQSSSNCSSWADPRARLLDGAQWEAVQADVLQGLSLEEPVAEHLARTSTGAGRGLAVDGRAAAAASPAPGRQHAHTGRARLGYDRARALLDTYAGLDPHQLRHSAATHLGDAEVPLQLIMGKTRRKKPQHRHALRQTRPRNHRQGH